MMQNATKINTGDQFEYHFVTLCYAIETAV